MAGIDIKKSEALKVLSMKVQCVGIAGIVTISSVLAS